MGEMILTPELLSAIEQNAHLAPDVHRRYEREYMAPVIAGHPAYLVVLALVSRIRELESALETDREQEGR